MTDPDEGRLEGRIRSSSEGVHVPVAGYERVVASGKRRRTKGRLLASGIGVAVALAVVLPLRSLSHLGEGGTPASASNQGFLAFTKEVEGKREIWLVRSDGSDLHPVPTDLATVAEPSWSPDGTRLIFTGGTENNTEPSHLYAMSPDGSDFVQLTDAPGDVLDMDPAWSPDGGLIAFSRLEDGQSAIAVLDAASGSVTMLTGGEFNQANTPAWSPDGTRIAFTANLRGKYGIFVMNADGSGVHPITELDGSVGAESPAWSPDGTKIAFVRGGALYTMGADGTGESMIPTGPEVLIADGPGWSPDGSRIAFMGTICPTGTATTPGPGGTIIGCSNQLASVEIFTTTPQGGDLEQVTTGSGETAGFSPSGIENPSWQPSSSSLEPVATNAESARLIPSCGGAVFDRLPPDTGALTRFDSFDDLDMSRMGGETPYFQEFVSGYEWFVTQEGGSWRQLFGQSTSGRGYAYLRIESQDDLWTPVGWGQCQIELTAEGWGNARFVLDPKHLPDPGATSIRVLATEVACAGGMPPDDREVRAVVEESEDEISIVILVEPTKGGADCPGNPAFPYEVELSSPIGDRTILDASTYPPNPAGG